MQRRLSISLYVYRLSVSGEPEQNLQLSNCRQIEFQSVMQSITVRQSGQLN